MINYNGFEKAKKEFIMKRCQQVILDFQKKQRSLEIFERLFKNLDDIKENYDILEKNIVKPYDTYCYNNKYLFLNFYLFYY